jgi:hypothetical protein
MAVKYEYEGKPQKIVPLSIENFIELLKTLRGLKQRGKFLKHASLSNLYEQIISTSRQFKDSSEWVQNIPTVISSWKQIIEM